MCAISERCTIPVYRIKKKKYNSVFFFSEIVTSKKSAELGFKDGMAKHQFLKWIIEMAVFSLRNFTFKSLKNIILCYSKNCKKMCY